MDFSKIKIVSVDDNENNLMLVEAICMELGASVESFSDPLDGLMYSLQNEVDIIILDYMMPNLNGIEFIKEFRNSKKIVPIVMVTAAGSDDTIHKEAFEAGVNDFLSKPINSILFKARITTLLQSYQSQLLLLDRAKHLESEVQKATQNLINREHETLKILGKTAEYKDPETASHVARVAHYSKLLAKAYGLDEKEQDIIFYASPFHDLGKVGIEDKILLKPGKLDEDEFEIMKTHASIGYEILKTAQSEFLQAGATIAITHHEKYNGKGYPNALAGEDINLYGRIVAIVDVFDALTSERPYKKAWSFEDALELLQKESGEHFDPKIVDLFVENIDEVKKIYYEFSHANEA
jgi:response regulator RpfG family c-di-GMP phosphodiesterase